MSRHARSGEHDLSNFARSGADFSASATASASASVEASFNDQASEYAKGVLDQAKQYKKDLEKQGSDKIKEYKKEFDQKYGEGSSNTALTAAEEGYELYTYLKNHVPVGEQYTSIKWDPNQLLKGDTSFETLKNQLADQARMSEATRKARDEDAKRTINKAAGTVAAIVATVPAYGTAAAAAIVAAGYALGYGLAAFDDWYSSDARKKDKRDQERALNAVSHLWFDWRIVPPSHDSEIYSSGQYADRLERILNSLQYSEGRTPSWRKQWVETSDYVINSKNEDISASDAYYLNWFPVSVEAFYGNSPEADERKLWFGQSVHVKKTPPKGGAGKVVEYDVVAPTYEEMVKRASKAVAGIAMAVAAQYGVPPQRVIERSYKAFLDILRASGPSSEKAALRMKTVYLFAVDEAKKVREEMVRDVADLRRKVAAEEAIRKAEAERFRKVLSSITQIREINAPTAALLRSVRDDIFTRKRKGESDAEYAARIARQEAEKTAAESKAAAEAMKMLADEQMKMIAERRAKDDAEAREKAEKKARDEASRTDPLSFWAKISGQKTASLVTTREPMSTGTKVALGVGVIALIGGGGYYFYKRSRQ